MLAGLAQLNIELTSKCSKHTTCSFCGHQDRKTNPNLQFGDMRFDLLRRISHQVPPPIVISFHRDGDSVDYPQLREALALFTEHPVSLVTHGERLAEKADEIIGRATTVTVSIVPKDPDREIQLASLRAFIAKKGDKPPVLQLKFVGVIERPEEYEALGVRIINRALHSKKININYQRHPAIPEIGVCLEVLGKPTIDWRGRVFQCNRLDVRDEGLIGDLNLNTLDEIWNGPDRKRIVDAHIRGRRDLANKLCASCDYWGIPVA